MGIMYCEAVFGILCCFRGRRWCFLVLACTGGDPIKVSTGVGRVGVQVTTSQAAEGVCRLKKLKNISHRSRLRSS